MPSQRHWAVRGRSAQAHAQLPLGRHGCSVRCAAARCLTQPEGSLLSCLLPRRSLEALWEAACRLTRRGGGARAGGRRLAAAGSTGEVCLDGGRAVHGRRGRAPQAWRASHAVHVAAAGWGARGGGAGMRESAQSSVAGARAPHGRAPAPRAAADAPGSARRGRLGERRGRLVAPGRIRLFEVFKA